MRQILFFLVIIIYSQSVFSQQINLVKKLNTTKTKTIRTDKKITVKTFDGEKFKGDWEVLDDDNILVQGREIKKDNIMMISGFIQSNSKDRAIGTGLLVGAGILFPVAVYYFLGGIAWGFSNGIFVGATLLVFDLLIAYAGTTMMGVFPRRFSSLNWEIELSGQPTPIPIPVPSD
jgi:hypothetical protein